MKSQYHSNKEMTKVSIIDDIENTCPNSNRLKIPRSKIINLDESLCSIKNDRSKLNIPRGSKKTELNKKTITSNSFSNFGNENKISNEILTKKKNLLNDYLKTVIYL